MKRGKRINGEHLFFSRSLSIDEAKHMHAWCTVDSQMKMIANQ